jgi:hypothetical protein
VTFSKKLICDVRVLTAPNKSVRTAAAHLLPRYDVAALSESRASLVYRDLSLGRSKLWFGSVVAVRDRNTV